MVPPDGPSGPAAASEDEGDEELVVRVRAGDRSAFADLVRKHREGIQRLVRGYVGGNEEAEDVTQETFLRALRAIDSFRGEASFRTWLYRIAVNVALNHARDQKRGRSVSLEEVELITNALGTGKMAAREARRKIGEALEHLPPKQRLVVEMRLIHEMPFRAIAGIAGSSEDAARANFQHAVKRLRALLAGDPEG
jgi:RNA polymerase sigma-70 factor (ECF subfamily)